MPALISVNSCSQLHGRNVARCFACLFLAIVAKVALGSVSAQQPELPTAFAGQWTGSAIQINPTAEWPLEITLTDGPIGTIVGAVEYPSIPCGGELTLSRISEAGNAVELAENLTYGEGVCADNGVVRLFANADDLLEYRWSHPTVNSPATGVLARVEIPTDLATPAATSHDVPPSATTARADVAFTFEDDVSPEDESYVREGIRLAQDGLVELFGIDVRESVSVVVEYDPEGGDFSNNAKGHRIAINTWNFRGYPPSFRVMSAIHEYFHVWEMELAHAAADGWTGPPWLGEGSADFVAWSIVADMGIVSADDAYQFIVAKANGIHASGPVFLPPLRDLTTYRDMFAAPADCCTYALGAIAVKMLTDEVGFPALRTYYERFSQESSWEAAFESAFGLPPEAFYEAFEVQRPALLTPTGRDVNAIARTPPFNDVPADVVVASATTPVARGEQALLTGWTASGAHCTATLLAPDGALMHTQPTYADAYGGVFWLWTVDPDESAGTATANVSCGGAPASVGIEIVQPVP